MGTLDDGSTQGMVGVEEVGRDFGAYFYFNRNAHLQGVADSAEHMWVWLRCCTPLTAPTGLPYSSARIRRFRKTAGPASLVEAQLKITRPRIAEVSPHRATAGMATRVSW